MNKPRNSATRGPVVWAEYQRKLDQLDVLFRFLHHAFQDFPESKRRAFVRALRSEGEATLAKEMQTFRDFMDETYKKGGQVVPSSMKKSIRRIESKELRHVKANYRSGTHAQYAEWVADGMVSSELLFRVTIFEDFLKHAHASMLTANTTILATCEPKRTVTYERLFAGSFDQFKHEAICREVEAVDRLNMCQRLDYFRDHLDIDFGDKRQWLIDISGIRNRVAHENPLYAITTEDTTIPLAGIRESISATLRDAMRYAFDHGQSQHPRQFLTERSPA